MPEVKAWRKRRDARVKAVAEGRLTEEADQVRWQDANIDVGSLMA
jgi:hypothetical protein